MTDSGQLGQRAQSRNNPREVLEDMSRYTGPKVKVLRRLGCELPGLSQKKSDRLGVPPGMKTFRRRRKSLYGERLQEKQKLRFNFGVSERQMLRLVKKATRQKGDTGVNLITLLEQRLDALVFRAGFAPSIPAARQMINHGHVAVDGRKCDIASCHVKPGQTFSIREKVREKSYIKDRAHEFGVGSPSFLEINPDACEAKLTATPTQDDFLLEIDTAMVVEFYSR